jgi:hypothetical protein
MKTFYISGSRTKLLLEVDRVFQEIVMASDHDGSIHAEISAEDNNLGADDWTIIFTNDDMERPEVADKIIAEVETR